MTRRREDREERQLLERFDEEIERLAHAVIGAAIAVHKALGPGYPESVYANSIAIEMTARDTPYEREYAFDVVYRDNVVGSGKVDFFVVSRRVVELKAVDALSDAHTGQVVTYLTQVKQPLGLLLNFGAAVLASDRGLKRVVERRFRK